MTQIWHCCGCGIGYTSSDLTLAWELLYAAGVSLKDKKKKKQSRGLISELWILRSSPTSPTVIPFQNLLVDALLFFTLEFLVTVISDIGWSVLTASSFEPEATFLILCTWNYASVLHVTILWNMFFLCLFKQALNPVRLGSHCRFCLAFLIWWFQCQLRFIVFAMLFEITQCVH